MDPVDLLRHGEWVPSGRQATARSLPRIVSHDEHTEPLAERLKGLTMTVILHSLKCDEPATSFGDDIEIFVNGVSTGTKIQIDQGQTWNLTALDPHVFTDIAVGDTVTFQFDEDSDAGKPFDRVVTKGTHHESVQVKSDGKYQFFWIGAD
jgi:hypothetical protein